MDIATEIMSLRVRLEKIERAVLENSPGQRLPISSVCKKFKTSPGTVRRYINAGYVDNVGQPGKVLIYEADAAKCWERK